MDNINQPNNQNPGTTLPKDTAKPEAAGNNEPTNSKKAKRNKKDKKKDDHVEKMLPSMVSYEKKRKQKKIILAVLGVSFVGVSMLSIIAFLGRYSGNFTVKLDNGIQSELTMSDNKDFTEGTGTTYLRASGLQYPKPITVDTIPSDTGALSLDLDKGGSKNSSLYFTKSGKPITLLTEDESDLANETDAMLWTTSLPDGYSQTDLYFCYTFFVKNPSFDSASPYMVSMTLDAETLPDDSTAPSLSSIMRVRCYENLVTEDEADITHNYATYAKALTTPTTNTDGTMEYREHVSGTNTKSAYYSEWCQNFYADNTVFSSIKTLEPNTTMRYTVLLWLEGYDVDCKGSSDMSGSSISFSMHFYGQENGASSSSSSNS